MTLREKLESVLDDLSRESFYEGYELGDGDYADDGWYPQTSGEVDQIIQILKDEGLL